jgi:uncharacterized membrane protein YuzA (DUF378 family)
MNNSEITHLNEVIWAIAAIGFGLLGIFFQAWYIDRLTRIPLFKWQEQEMNKPYTRATITLLSILFVILGVTLLLGMWHVGPQ